MAASKRTPLAKVIAALKATGGIKAYAAEKCGISRQAMHTRVLESPELTALVAELRETVGDMAEGTVVKLIKDGDFQASKFYLETQCKDRGYTRRTDIAGVVGEPIQFIMQNRPPKENRDGAGSGKRPAG